MLLSDRSPEQSLQKFLGSLRSHERFRSSSLNLLASENVLSPLVRQALASDLAGRYSSSFYGGTRYIQEIIELTKSYAKDVFHAEFACISPISGHLCDLAALRAYTRRGDTIALIDKDMGGYPFDIGAFDRQSVFLPFDTSIWDLEYKKLTEVYEHHSPRLTLLGASVIAYPTRFSDFPEMNNDHVVVYDGSHVLGLIAGGKFQNPLQEGIPILFGSTHKSFPGPQGGLILGNDQELFEKIASQFTIQASQNPFDHQGTILVDNIHVNRIAALGITLLELAEFGKEYATQVVRNAQTLGRSLKSLGFPVITHPLFGVTESHQVLLPYSTEDGLHVKEQLEQNRILVDAFVRIGTAEVTRRGMKEAEMKYIAELIGLVLNEKNNVENQVLELVNEFSEIHYCFTDYSFL